MSTELENSLQERGIDLKALIKSIQDFRIETPSWGYGNSGTRFKVFPWPGAARNLHEKLEDAAEVQRVTGICPGVAIHIPWDKATGQQPGAMQPSLVYIWGPLTPISFRTMSIVWAVSVILTPPSAFAPLIMCWSASRLLALSALTPSASG